MANHAKDNSQNPQSTKDAPWHCSCGYSTSNTSEMAGHVEHCRG